LPAITAPFLYDTFDFIKVFKKFAIDEIRNYAAANPRQQPQPFSYKLFSFYEAFQRDCNGKLLETAFLYARATGLTVDDITSFGTNSNDAPDEIKLQIVCISPELSEIDKAVTTASKEIISVIKKLEEEHR